jgi:hypothetical protein
MSRWEKSVIELPPEWQEAVAGRADELGCSMRYLWMAAISRLMALPVRELERLALRFELIARRDIEKLASAGPGQCEELVTTWTADLAASLYEGGRRASPSHRRRSG